MTGRDTAKRHIVKGINKTLPIGSSRREVAKKFYYSLKAEKNFKPTKNISYDKWVKYIEPKLWSNVPVKGPLVSIVVPCFNTPKKYIEPLIQSVINQTYGNWQLILADGSTNNESKVLIKDLAARDKRILYIQIGSNLGIVGNTNLGLREAKGTFIGFLDHDDILSEHALSEVVFALSKDPKLDLIYSDEDKLSDNGKQRTLPFFKPGWSPDLILGVNYITHFVVARKALVDKIGGLRPNFDGSQDYDFILRITEHTERIKHIPKILYHWRLAAGSTSGDVGEKGYADKAGRQALSDALIRRGINAEVVGIPDRPTNYRIRYNLPKNQPKVSIIIPFKDKSELLKQCVESIFEKTTYKNYELILISNNSTEKALFDYLSTLKNDKRCHIFTWDHPFNYSKINNYGRKQATGQYLVLLNNDTEVLTNNWLEELVGVASQPDVGAVGALLYYPNKTIQHAGVVLGINGMAGHVFRERLTTDWTDFGLASWPRDYLAVTAACLTIAVDKFDKVGGMDETFIVAGNDVALGISLHEAGYRNIYWPFAELIHHENASIGSYKNVPIKDYKHSLKYYRPYLNWRDPYFNANLDLMNEQIGLRSDI